MERSLPVAQINFTQSSTTTEEEGNRNEGNEQAFSSEVVALAVSEGKEIEPETVKDAECQTTEFDYIRKIDYLKTSNVIAWK